MDNLYLQLATFILITVCEVVESRYCTYITADGPHTIICSSYEYCCGNACCRPTALKFYHLWYFWLSVILILLLCSGGSWWYRFRYRNYLLSQRSPFTHVTGSHGPTQRPNSGVLYYPGADRVYLHTQPKDLNTYVYLYNTGARPPNSDFSYQAYPPPAGAHQLASVPPSHPSYPPPPPYGVPPPSYDSIVQSESNTFSNLTSSNQPNSGTSSSQQSQRNQVPQTPSNPLRRDENLHNRKCDATS